MPKKLILIVGLAGSGKSTVANFIKKKFNADVFHTGDIIREEIRRRGLKYTTEADDFFARWFHTGDREKLLVKRIWDKIKNSKKNLIVIDGFRCDKNPVYLEEISRIKPIIISVTASLDVRIRRKFERGRFGKKEGIRQIKLRDKSEKSYGLDKIMKMADYTIDNSNLSIKQTNEKVSRIMKEII